MTQFCALCDVLGERPRRTASSIGLRTARPEIIAQAREHFDKDERDAVHVVVAVCPEHVVEVYRGRVAGVSMAWRIASIPS